MHNKLPLISIVVPSFNQKQYIRKTLDSLLAQEYPKLEIIVMDGGSTDGSTSIIQEYEKHLTYWQSEPDGGQSAAINAGVARASGDIVGWLNSDDFFLPRVLWHVARSYQQHTTCGLYIGNGLRYDERSDCFLPFSRHHVCLNRQALKQGVDYILQPSTFFLRQAWNELDGLDELLHYCMDWDLILRIASRYPVMVIQENIAVSREYEDTKTSTGGIARILELNRMTAKHSGLDFTIGMLHYTLATLQELAPQDDELINSLYGASLQSGNCLKIMTGNSDGFPVMGDEGDFMYLPRGAFLAEESPRVKRSSTVKISIVFVVREGEQRFISTLLESVRQQMYPNIEVIACFADDEAVGDGNECDVLEAISACVYGWSEGSWDGVAKQVTGDVVTVISVRDTFAADVLWEVMHSFKTSLDLGAVYGNALFVNADGDDLVAIDYGKFKSAFLNGTVNSAEELVEYWKWNDLVPAPGVFFSSDIFRSIAPTVAVKGWSWRYEIFYKALCQVKQKVKLEKTLFYHAINSVEQAGYKEKLYVDLYDFSRGCWPLLFSWSGMRFLWQFMGYFSVSCWPGGLRLKDRVVWAWLAAGMLCGFVNPEKVRCRLHRKAEK